MRALVGGVAGFALVFLVAAAALSTAPAVPWAGTAAPTPAVFQNFNVSGHVADANAHTPIAGAQVRANSGPSTITASDGNYTLQVPSGLETLQYSANGYRKGSITIFVKTNVGNVNVFLLPFTYVVTGLVTDAKTHAPIAGATVAVEPGGDTVTTSPSGQYTFGLENGTFSLIVSAPGYLSQNVSIRVSGASVNGPVSLSRPDAGASTPPWTLYLIAAGVAALAVAAAVAFVLIRRRRALAALRPPETPPAHVTGSPPPTAEARPADSEDRAR